MTPEFVLGLGHESIKLVLLLSLPLLGTGLIVGLFVAIIQATTQIQEMTLSFVPKIVAVLLALLAATPWMLSKLSSFTVRLISELPLIMK